MSIQATISKKRTIENAVVGFTGKTAWTGTKFPTIRAQRTRNTVHHLRNGPLGNTVMEENTYLYDYSESY